MLVIVADESVDDPLVHALRTEGWIVWSVSEECPSVDDEFVLDAAAEKGAVLLTMDSDFGELIFERRQPPPYAVIFIRNKGLSLARATKQVMTTLRSDDLAGRFLTLSRNTKRSRLLPNWKTST